MSRCSRPFDVDLIRFLCWRLIYDGDLAVPEYADYHQRTMRHRERLKRGIGDRRGRRDLRAARTFETLKCLYQHILQCRECKIAPYHENMHRKLQSPPAPSTSSDYGAQVDFETYKRFGLHENFTEVHGDAAVNGRRNREIMKALDTPGDTIYEPCAEALAEGPTCSSISYFPDWRSSAVYPDTVRDVWIVCPDELTDEVSPALLVFNDGHSYLNAEGPVRAQRVLDAVNADGTVGPVVGVFVTPGCGIDLPPSSSPWEMNRDPRAALQRSIEYDSMTDRYASLLVDEVIPFVQDHLGSSTTDDPARRGVVGHSSGGICAWTAAWHCPDQFGLVLSHCGSFVNLRGGHAWPYLIRSTERHPIRVFMQSGESDADIIYGSWPLANQQVAAALEFAGYDMRFEFGTGGHTLRHAGSMFAESLRWLFNPASLSVS